MSRPPQVSRPSRRRILPAFSFRAIALAIWAITYAVAWSPANAAGGIHALYIGIAEYRFGRPTVPSANFENLRAAPQDIETIRRTIDSRVKVDSAHILIGPQATRDGILAALNRFSSGAEGSAGDTLLIYYTGHGGRLPDPSGDQPSGYHSTLVPYDARDPLLVINGTYGDLTDTELREHIQAIAARGLNVVSIFDSCNSGTATRSPVRPAARQKTVPVVPREALVHVAPRNIQHGQVALRPGYVVHFAAAADRATAWEDERDGVVRSDFTQALAEAILRAPPGSTYEDIFVDARRRLLQMGLAADDKREQEPQSEGDLRMPFLGAASKGARVFTLREEAGGQYKLDGGKIAGFGKGSILNVFATVREAIAPGAQPIAEAEVTTAGDWESQLDVRRTALWNPADILYGVEKSPAYGDRTLKIRLIGSAATDPRIAGILAPLTFLEPSASSGAYGLMPDAGRLIVLDAAGGRLRSFDPADSAGIKTFLQGLAQFHALLNLAERGDKLRVDFEITAEGCAGQAVPLARFENGEPSFSPGNEFFLRIRNHENREIYPYVLRLAPDFAVRPIDPPPGTNAQTLQPALLGKPWCYARKYRATGKGRDRLLLIVADRPLPGILSLQQAALRSSVPGDDPLERLLRNAAAGRRGEAGPIDAGLWNAKLISFSVGQ